MTSSPLGTDIRLAIRKAAARRAWDLTKGAPAGDAFPRQFAGIGRTALKNLHRVALEATVYEEIAIVLEYQANRRVLDGGLAGRLSKEFEGMVQELEKGMFSQVLKDADLRDAAKRCAAQQLLGWLSMLHSGDSGSKKARKR